MAPGPTNQPQYSNDNLLMNLRFVGQMVKTSTKKKWFDLSVFERSSLNIETLAEFNDMISFAFEKFNVEHYGHFLDMGFHLVAFSWEQPTWGRRKAESAHMLAPRGVDWNLHISAGFQAPEKCSLVMHKYAQVIKVIYIYIHIIW